MNKPDHLASELFGALSKEPNRPAIIDYGLPSPTVLKRGILLNLALRLALELRSEVEENRVGVVLPPGLGGVVANLAILFADKVPVNLNFTLGPETVSQSMREAGVKTILTAKSMVGKFPKFPWPDSILDVADKLKDYRKEKFSVLLRLLWLRVAPHSFAKAYQVPLKGGSKEGIILFTSGSSGSPKGVVLTHDNLLANCRQISQVGLFAQDSKILANLPLFHSFGFTIATLYPLLDGLQIVAAPSPLDLSASLRAIREEGVDVVLGTPTFLRGYLRKAKQSDLKSIRFVVAGAERTPPPLREKWERQCSCRYLEGYGLTEASPVISLNLPGEGSRALSVGRLLPGIESKTVHPETRKDLPSGETGILCFRGKNIFNGYLNQPEKTRVVLTEGKWFITGDLGHIDAAGFLFIKGRLSRFSKIGGEMVPHEVVEEAVAQVLGFAGDEEPACVITGVEDEAKGECLILYVSTDFDSNALRKKLAEDGLPNLWIPKQIRRIEKIPLLPTGKLDFQAIRNLAMQG